MSEIWPWITLAGLGAYHGINPAMGWLFATALALYRRRRTVIATSLVPIILGHTLSISLVAGAVIAAGLVTNRHMIQTVAGLILLAWGAYHLAFGARHRVRVGMQTGFTGLFFWSFLMASAHGAGLMLVTAVIPLCLTDTPAGRIADNSLGMALAAISVHTAAMMATTAAMAVLVYDVVGVAILRRGWINLDLLWSAALIGTGLVLLPF